MSRLRAAFCAVGALLFGCAARTTARSDVSMSMPAPVGAEIDRAKRLAQQRELPDRCWSVDPLQSIGTTRRAVGMCGVHPDAGPNQLRRGGIGAPKFAILFEDRGYLSYAHTAEQVRASLAPIDDWSLALALVALRYPLWDGRRDGGFAWKQLVRPLPEPSVEPVGDGWRVRWPSASVFGCTHDLKMREFIVTRDGETSVVESATQHLAESQANICVD